MADSAKRQISFKLDPEIAQRLDVVATERGVSCHEAARSLMLATLMAGASEGSAKPPASTPGQVFSMAIGDLMSRLQRIEEAVAVDREPAISAPLPDAYAGNQVALMRAARLLAREAAHLRTQHLPALRTDMQTAVVALLCKGATQLDPAAAAAWVETRLNAPIPDLGAIDA